MDLYKYKDCSIGKKSVLRTIYEVKEISRSELAERTGLSSVSLSKYISEFMADGIVDKNGSLESSGGRRPDILRINPSYAYVIGIDIGAYSSKIGVVRLDGSLVEKNEILMKRTMPAQGFSFEDLCGQIEALFSKYGSSRFMGIGIGISGMVDFPKGKVIFCPNISGWDGLHVVELLQEKYGVPVFLDTSSRCMALAEYWFGAGRNIGNQILISIGYSVGAGIIADSRIFRGSGSFSGELGHIQVDEKGKRCSCGNYGCLELYVTLPMILKRISTITENAIGYSPLKLLAKDREKIDVELVRNALEQGDKVVNEVMVDTGRLIGIVLANMSNIINPELLVLGGGVIESFPMLVDEAARTIKERSLVTILQNLEVKRSALGGDAPVIGSAVLVIEKIFE